MLTGSEIKKQIELGRIKIEPFAESNVRPNSYDLSLSSKLVVYDDEELDCKQRNTVNEIIIPEEGLLLQPGKLYLGSTIEKTQTDFYIPLLHGKSSLGRLGLDIHKTAGFGDIGYVGNWTLILTVVQPLRIYSNMKIAQIQFDVAVGDIPILYRDREDSHYAHSVGATASKMHENFKKKD